MMTVFDAILDELKEHGCVVDTCHAYTSSYGYIAVGSGCHTLWLYFNGDYVSIGSETIHMSDSEFMSKIVKALI